MDDARCRFCHVSTDEVLGYGACDPAFTESAPYAPRSPYSATKAGFDHLVRAYRHTYGLPVVLTNCSNNYGSRQHAEKFIPTIIRSCLAGSAIPVYGNGGNVRLVLRDRPLPGDRFSGAARQARRELQHRRQQRALEHRAGPPHLRDARPRGSRRRALRPADRVGHRPYRPRLALRHGHRQDPRRTRLVTIGVARQRPR